MIRSWHRSVQVILRGEVDSPVGALCQQMTPRLRSARYLLSFIRIVVSVESAFRGIQREHTELGGSSREQNAIDDDWIALNFGL